MNIGTLAKETGLAQSRIRYYEAQGLLGPVQRKANGYRLYGQETKHILGIITTAQEAGFSLDEIRNLLPQADSTGFDMVKLVASLKAKLADVVALQARLARTQAELEALVARIESGDHTECFNKAVAAQPQ
ncbi:MAG: MerR family transcriptional regulator [Pseudomonadota bacterium]